jgi:hypothetical protein
LKVVDDLANAARVTLEEFQDLPSGRVREGLEELAQLAIGNIGAPTRMAHWVVIDELSHL